MLRPSVLIARARRGPGDAELRIHQAVEQVGLPPVVPRERGRGRAARPADPADARRGDHPGEAPQVPAHDRPFGDSRPFRPVDLCGSHRVSLPDGRIRGTPVIDATLRRAPRWTGVRTPGARPALRRPAAARRRRSARGAGRGVPAARPGRLRSGVRGVARRGRAGAGVVRQRDAAGRGRAAPRVRRDRHAPGARRIGRAGDAARRSVRRVAAPGRGPFRACRVGVHRSVPARRGRAARRPVRRHPLAPRRGSRHRLPGRRRSGRPALPAAGPDLDLRRGHRRGRPRARARRSRPRGGRRAVHRARARGVPAQAGRAEPVRGPGLVPTGPAALDRGRAGPHPRGPRRRPAGAGAGGAGADERAPLQPGVRPRARLPAGRLRRAGAGRRGPPAAGVRAGPRGRGRRAVGVRLGRDHATGVPPPPGRGPGPVPAALLRRRIRLFPRRPRRPTTTPTKGRDPCRSRSPSSPA